MKDKIILLLFSMLFTCSFSQRKSNIECGFFGTKTIEQRNNLFPFSKAKKVIMISYPNEDGFVIMNDDGTTRTSKNDSLDLAKFGFIIEKEFKFQYNDTLPIKVFDATKIVELYTNEINDLSNLMFNFNYKIINKKKPIESSITKCYTPRNAFIFLDEKDKIISVLEICFECQQYNLIPNSENFGNVLGKKCDKTLVYFEEIFLKKGFKTNQH
jgi:acyl carrier protein